MSRLRISELSHWSHWLAVGLGSGLAPKAPGTFGTLAAIPLYLLFASTNILFYGLILIISFILGIWLCGKTANHLGVHDHSGIVWDEFVGMWLTLFLAPVTITTILVAFLLFRFFDILKPWPIRWFDRRVHGGLGIMIDDIIAGLFAWCCLQSILNFTSVITDIDHFFFSFIG